MPRNKRLHIRPVKGLFLVGLSAVLGVTLVGAPVRGQEGPAANAQNEHLREVAARQQQLADETKAFNETWNKHAAEVNTLVEKRQALRDKRLQAEISLRQLQEGNQALTETLNRKQAEAATLRRAVTGIDAAGRNLDEKLTLHLAEVPGEEPENPPAPEKPAEHSLNSGSRDIADHMRQVFARAETKYAQSARIRLNHQSIFTAGGTQENAALLSVGHIAAAYITDEGQKVGYALASPNDASGFRWCETISEEARNQILSAVQTLKSPGGAETPPKVDIPVDVTGGLQADMLNTDTGLLTKLNEGGPVIKPLVLIALLALCVTLERWVVLYLFNPCGPVLDKKLRACMETNDNAACETLLSKARGVIPRVLLACLNARSRGVQAMEDAIQAQLLRELPPLRRFLAGLAILATIAPLLGLLGTVTGIIHTFEVLKTFGNADPHQLAGGISEALITTAAGLVIAIPILLVRGVLRGRTEKIIARAESRAAGLLIYLETKPEAAHGTLD